MRLGEAAHRARVPVAVRPYSAGVKAGVAGAVAMAAVAIVFGLLVKRSPWYPINLMAAAGLPSLANADLAQLRAFNGMALVVGTIVHGALSILVGLLYAVILPTLPRYPDRLGRIRGPRALDGARVVDARSRESGPQPTHRVALVRRIAGRLRPGGRLGRSHECEPVATMQTWPLAARMGIESPGVFDEEQK